MPMYLCTYVLIHLYFYISIFLYLETCTQGIGHRAQAQGRAHRAQVAGHRAKGLDMDAYTYILI